MKETVKTVTITLLLAVSTQAFAGNLLFWSNWVDKTISRAQTDGSDVQIIDNGFLQGRGIAIDPENDFLYWATGEPNGSSYDTVFYKARLNGTERTELFRLSQAGGYYFDIALDLTHQKIYWIEYLSPNYKLMRADFDGSDSEIVFSSTLFLHDLELDIENNFVYWSTWKDNSIWRADLDGTNPIVIFNSNYYNSEVNHVALSPDKSYLYATVRTDMYSSAGRSIIFKIDTSNPGNATEISGSFPSELTWSNRFKGIVVNPANNRIYFNVTTSDQQGPAAIYSCNQDGSDLQAAVSGLTGEPWALLIGPGPECVDQPAGDLDGDCKVNLNDFAIFASGWLNLYFDVSFMAEEWLDCGLVPTYECNKF